MTHRWWGSPFFSLPKHHLAVSSDAAFKIYTSNQWLNSQRWHFTSCSACSQQHAEQVFLRAQSDLFPPERRSLFVAVASLLRFLSCQSRTKRQNSNQLHGAASQLFIHQTQQVIGLSRVITAGAEQRGLDCFNMIFKWEVRRETTLFRRAKIFSLKLISHFYAWNDKLHLQAWKFDSTSASLLNRAAFVPLTVTARSKILLRSLHWHFISAFSLRFEPTWLFYDLAGIIKCRLPWTKWMLSVKRLRTV